MGYDNELLDRFLTTFSIRQSALTIGTPDSAAHKGMRYVTVRRPPNREDVSAHFAGKRSIVGIPLLENDTVQVAWADLDIGRDFEGPRMPNFSSRIFRYAFRSKSGGAHYPVFFPRPMPPAMVRALLRVEMDRLGFPQCEIFPKQNAAVIGSAINLPFFGDPVGFSKFFPETYDVPILDWPLDVKEAEAAAQGSDGEPGLWDDKTLLALLTAYKEALPDFKFSPGRKGYVVPCPGEDEGWEDGARHTTRGRKLQHDTEVFLKNDQPKFLCFHAHCNGDCGSPKKTFNNWRAHYDPLGILFNVYEYIDSLVMEAQQ